eukprot:5258635-Pleurochrysis_carterae.AAC.4
MTCDRPSVLPRPSIAVFYCSCLSHCTLKMTQDASVIHALNGGGTQLMSNYSYYLDNAIAITADR